MDLNAKKIVIAVMGILFLVSLIIVSWIEGGKQRFAPEPKLVLSGDSESCYQCHLEKTPNIAKHWTDSTHSKRGVGCFECHQADKADVDAWTHEGKVISTIVTPKDCARCHQDIVHEFTDSHHAKAAEILGSLDNVLGEIIEGIPATVNGCTQCHGSKVALLKDDKGEVKRDKEWLSYELKESANGGVEIKMQDKLISCEMCNRILYLEEDL